MSNLAILGGTPQRTHPFSSWPQYTADDLARLHAEPDAANGFDLAVSHMQILDFEKRRHATLPR